MQVGIVYFFINLEEYRFANNYSLRNSSIPTGSKRRKPVNSYAMDISQVKKFINTEDFGKLNKENNDVSDSTDSENESVSVTEVGSKETDSRSDSQDSQSDILNKENSLQTVIEILCKCPEKEFNYLVACFKLKDPKSIVQAIEKWFV